MGRPLRPCNQIGCHELVRPPERYCEAHRWPEEQRQRQRRYDEERGTAARRGYGYRWQKARERWLKRNPLCEACKAKGRVTEATVVDHIVPHRGDMKKFWDTGNWQSLCAPCHSTKTARGE